MGPAGSQHRRTNPFSRRLPMHNYQQRVLQSFRRALGWLRFHTDAIMALLNQPAGPATAADGSPGATQASAQARPGFATQIEVLDGVVARLADYAAEHQTQSVRSTRMATDEEELVDALFGHIRSICNMAQALHGIVP